MRLDGSRLRRVNFARTRTTEDVEPQWSPDGRQIVFVRHNITARPRDEQAVVVVNADGSGLRRVTPYAIRAGGGPDWSPDGTQILFRSPQTEDFTLWTIHPDGTGLRQPKPLSDEFQKAANAENYAKAARLLDAQ